MNFFSRTSLPVALCTSLLCFPTPIITVMTTYPLKESTISMNDNPLLQPWQGNYGGVPPFDQVKTEHFVPAFNEIRKAHLMGKEAIANNASAPDFENTIVALEKSDRLFSSFKSIYSIWSRNLSTPEFQNVERELAPRLAAIDDEIYQNEKLFRRIETVYNSNEKQKLSPEQQRLVWLYYNNFTRAGARLSDQAKDKLKKLNTRLANLFTRFQQNVLADETNIYLVIDNENDLKGLPESVKEAAKTEAKEKKLNGKWVISNTRSSVDPFLTHAENRSLREKAWRMFTSRGDNANEFDNNKIITEILKLRKERATLLGYKTHAHWRLEDTMAKTPERAMKLLEDVWTPALKRVKEEVADMQVLADKEKGGITIEPWDYHFYMEKVRKDRFAFDQDELKPYLQLDKLRQGMFYVAEELFNLRFVPITDVPVFHEDVRTWKVEDKTTNATVGVYYFDPFARKGKRSGAWMNTTRAQENMDKQILTIVGNNSNFIKGKPNEPVLISWDDAQTLFHEFGHALHGLSSNVTYRSLSGTAVFRDYVEFPSQLLEHWLSTPEVRQKYMLHYRSDKPIPADLIRKSEKASTFKQGYITLEYLASALIDMKLHMSDSDEIDPDTFEKETLEKLKMPREIVMRHRTPQFSHVFSSDSYSAGYYSYLWSDVITSDAWEAFEEAGNGFDKEVASRLKKYIFSIGNTIDPAEGYRLFRGHDPKILALMKKRGFN